jgi:hypothetical protein
MPRNKKRKREVRRTDVYDSNFKQALLNAKHAVPIDIIPAQLATGYTAAKTFKRLIFVRLTPLAVVYSIANISAFNSCGSRVPREGNGAAL